MIKLLRIWTPNSTQFATKHAKFPIKKSDLASYFNSIEDEDMNLRNMKITCSSDSPYLITEKNCDIFFLHFQIW